MDIDSKLNQTCVYWQKTGVDIYNTPVFAEPVDIKCRWEDKTVLYISLTGEQMPSRAVVFTECDTAPGDMLWLGNVESLPEEYSEEIDIRTFAHSIQRSDKIPDLRAEIYLRTAYL